MNRWIRRSVLTGAGAALMVLTGAVAAAQTNSKPAEAQHTIQLVPAKAVLSKSLDAKKAKQGDPVAAKLEESVKLSDEQELPKNTVLEGHIDRVQASEHKSDSSIEVTFDKARLKNGQELPVKATVMAIAEPALPGQQNRSASPMGGMADTPGVGPMAPSAQQMGGNAAQAPQARGTPMSTQQETSAEGAPMQTTQQSNVPGVTLQSDIHEHTSATFLSKGRNVDVPGGTLLGLAIAVVPAGTQVQ
jgi:hypothetical protein